MGSWNTDRRRNLKTILDEMNMDVGDGRLGPVYKVDALRWADQEGDETYTDKEFFIVYVVAESAPARAFAMDTDRKRRFTQNIAEIESDFETEDNAVDLFEADVERTEWTPKARKGAPESALPIPTSKDEETQEGERATAMSTAAAFERVHNYSDIAYSKKVVKIKYRVNEHRLSATT